MVSRFMHAVNDERSSWIDELTLCTIAHDRVQQPLEIEDIELIFGLLNVPGLKLFDRLPKQAGYKLFIQHRTHDGLLLLLVRFRRRILLHGIRTATSFTTTVA